MQKAKSSRSSQSIVAVLLIPCLILLNLPVLASQPTTSPPNKPATATKIVHQPLKTVDSGSRPTITAEIEDPMGIELARVYFKAVDSDDYSFVALEPDPSASRTGIVTRGVFRATLPAPAGNAGWFDYLILVKNFDQVVVKSQNYTVSVYPRPAETAPAKPPLAVFSEPEQQPTKITGFADNVTLSGVSPEARYGATAGLYPEAAGVVTAVPGGTVTASSGGLTGDKLLIGAVAVTAVVVAGAALAGGGGSSGGAEPLQPEPEPETVPEEESEPVEETAPAATDPPLSQTDETEEGVAPVLAMSRCPQADSRWGGEWRQLSDSCPESAGAATQTGTLLVGRWQGAVDDDCRFHISPAAGEPGPTLVGVVAGGEAQLQGVDLCGIPLSFFTARFSGNAIAARFPGGSADGSRLPQ